MEHEFLTAQELAEKLNLSVETIWRYTREEKIPTIVIGTRQYRYNLQDVLQSLPAKTTQEHVVSETKGDYTVGSHYTYDDYAALPAEPSYKIQLIDGGFVKEPGPILQHQRVSSRLQMILNSYFLQTNPQGELFDAPIDLVLSVHSVVQPDLVFVSDAADLTNPKYIDVVPMLIVEILSPSNRRTDTIRKLDLYRRHGVLHYWMVDPEEGIIQALKLQDGKYLVVTVEDQEFEHPDFPGLLVNMPDLIVKPI